MTAKIPLRTMVLILALSVGAGVASVFVQSPPTAEMEWKFDDSGYTYTIHGTTNFGRGNTYYLYREKEGKREVLLVDPKSPADLTRFTDRPVLITGVMVREGGVDMVRITAVRDRD